MIIAVDVDDVCADLVPAWLDRYNLEYDDCLTRESCTEWDLTKIVKPECGAAIYDYLKDPQLYDFVEPIDGARTGVAALRRANHQVVFVTSCGYDAQTVAASAGAKLEWLQRYGFLPRDASAAKHYIIASDKSRIRADILIDDRPLNVDTFWGRGLLFDQPHNRTAAPLRVRVMNWFDAVRAVEA